MHDLGNVGGDDGREVRELMAQFDAPAYVRRARRVEGAYEQLVERCRNQREKWLAMVRTRLGRLVALAGGPDGLPRWFAGDHLDVLCRLHAELRPALRTPVRPTASARTLRRAAADLRQTVEQFNRRWQSFLGDLDLRPLNDLRDGYNRYYVLEKECAIHSPRLARLGFRALAPLTTDDVATVLPPLPHLPAEAG
jgi:hypothetical protein